MENLLTIEQTAQRLQLDKTTVRRQIKRGALRGIKRGRQWRVPESALMESSAPVSVGEVDEKETVSIPQAQAPQMRANLILEALQSGNKAQRSAAIIRLAKSDAATIEIVEDAIEAAEAAYKGPQDDLSDWRALDGEPFHFPEEAAAYPTGLYKAEAERC